MQDPQNYFTEIITGFLSSLSAAGITWFYSRKKQVKEVEALELDLVDRAIRIWRETGEALEAKVNKLEGRVNDLSDENVQLKIENKGLRKEILTLTKRVQAFITKYGE
ncbi:hypothetical protein [Dyadobacter frigoris]|uniref:Uncharacterized protein n=1 Tax=Dyadobacter frigoris TaxID=2576211 RepID=A0A4U6CZW1_9BACT|nr:hypothetical protein [Dyadobacter frigoris]TKT89475.1 hypothetical protein FDK13_24340 [Dyadobacter frigoris]